MIKNESILDPFKKVSMNTSQLGYNKAQKSRTSKTILRPHDHAKLTNSTKETPLSVFDFHGSQSDSETTPRRPISVRGRRNSGRKIRYKIKSKTAPQELGQCEKGDKSNKDNSETNKENTETNKENTETNKENTQTNKENTQTNKENSERNKEHSGANMSISDISAIMHDEGEPVGNVNLNGGNEDLTMCPVCGISLGLGPREDELHINSCFDKSEKSSHEEQLNNDEALASSLQREFDETRTTRLSTSRSQLFGNEKAKNQGTTAGEDNATSSNINKNKSDNTGKNTKNAGNRGKGRATKKGSKGANKRTCPLCSKLISSNEIAFQNHLNTCATKFKTSSSKLLQLLNESRGKPSSSNIETSSTSKGLQYYDAAVKDRIVGEVMEMQKSNVISKDFPCTPAFQKSSLGQTAVTINRPFENDIGIALTDNIDDSDHNDVDNNVDNNDVDAAPINQPSDSVVGCKAASVSTFPNVANTRRRLWDLTSTKKEIDNACFFLKQLHSEIGNSIHKSSKLRKLSWEDQVPKKDVPDISKGRPDETDEGASSGKRTSAEASDPALLQQEHSFTNTQFEKLDTLLTLDDELSDGNYEDRESSIQDSRKILANSQSQKDVMNGLQQSQSGFIYEVYTEKVEHLQTRSTQNVHINLMSLLQSSAFSDFTFRCKDEECVSAHKLLLSINCDQLKNWIEEGNAEIDVTSSSETSVQHLLKYLYTGYLPPYDEHTLDVYKLATRFDLQVLKDVCLVYMPELKFEEMEETSKNRVDADAVVRSFWSKEASDDENSSSGKPGVEEDRKGEDLCDSSFSDDDFNLLADSTQLCRMDMVKTVPDDDHTKSISDLEVDEQLMELDEHSGGVGADEGLIHVCMNERSHLNALDEGLVVMGGCVISKEKDNSASDSNVVDIVDEEINDADDSESSELECIGVGVDKQRGNEAPKKDTTICNLTPPQKTITQICDLTGNHSDNDEQPGVEQKGMVLVADSDLDTDSDSDETQVESQKISSHIESSKELNSALETTSPGGESCIESHNVEDEIPCSQNVSQSFLRNASAGVNRNETIMGITKTNTSVSKPNNSPIRRNELVSSPSIDSGILLGDPKTPTKNDTCLNGRKTPEGQLQNLQSGTPLISSFCTPMVQSLATPCCFNTPSENDATVIAVDLDLDDVDDDILVNDLIELEGAENKFKTGHKGVVVPETPMVGCEAENMDIPDLDLPAEPDIPSQEIDFQIAGHIPQMSKKLNLAVGLSSSPEQSPSLAATRRFLKNKPASITQGNRHENHLKGVSSHSNLATNQCSKASSAAVTEELPEHSSPVTCKPSPEKEEVSPTKDISALQKKRKFHSSDESVSSEETLQSIGKFKTRHLKQRRKLSRSYQSLPPPKSSSSENDSLSDGEDARPDKPSPVKSPPWTNIQNSSKNKMIRTYSSHSPFVSATRSSPWLSAHTTEAISSTAPSIYKSTRSQKKKKQPQAKKKKNQDFKDLVSKQKSPDASSDEDVHIDSDDASRERGSCGFSLRNRMHSTLNSALHTRNSRGKEVRSESGNNLNSFHDISAIKTSRKSASSNSDVPDVSDSDEFLTTITKRKRKRMSKNQDFKELLAAQISGTDSHAEESNDSQKLRKESRLNQSKAADTMCPLYKMKTLSDTPGPSNIDLSKRDNTAISDSRKRTDLVDEDDDLSLIDNQVVSVSIASKEAPTCPMCGRSFRDLTTEQREAHVNICLDESEKTLQEEQIRMDEILAEEMRKTLNNDNNEEGSKDSNNDPEKNSNNKSSSHNSNSNDNIEEKNIDNNRNSQSNSNNSNNGDGKSNNNFTDQGKNGESIEEKTEIKVKASTNDCIVDDESKETTDRSFPTEDCLAEIEIDPGGEDIRDNMASPSKGITEDHLVVHQAEEKDKMVDEREGIVEAEPSEGKYSRPGNSPENNRSIDEEYVPCFPDDSMGGGNFTAFYLDLSTKEEKNHDVNNFQYSKEEKSSFSDAVQNNATHIESATPARTPAHEEINTSFVATNEVVYAGFSGVDNSVKAPTSPTKTRENSCLIDNFECSPGAEEALMHFHTPNTSTTSVHENVTEDNEGVNSVQNTTPINIENTENILVTTPVGNDEHSASDPSMSFVNKSIVRRCKAFGAGDSIHPVTKEPITPMPDYMALPTPQLKNEMKKFAIRDLPKFKMAAKMKEIYKFQHNFEEWEGDELEKPKRKPRATKSKDEGSTKTANSKISSASDEANSESGNASKDLKPPSKPKQKKTTKKAKAKAAANSSGDDTDSDSSVAADDKIPLAAKLMDYINNNPELHHKVLTYTPIEFLELYTSLKSTNIKCNKKQLEDFLDHQCICYWTLKDEATKQRKKRGRKAKTKEAVDSSGDA